MGTEGTRPGGAAHPSAGARRLLALAVLALLACDAPVAAPAPSVPPPPPSAPLLPEGELASSHRLGGQAHAVVVRGGHAYVADLDGLSTYALGPEGPPRRTAHAPTPGAARDVTLAGERLCVADGRQGLAFFELSEPGTPRLAERLPLPHPALGVRGGPSGVAVIGEGGHLMFVRHGSRAVEVLALPGDPRALAWVGTSLYVASRGDALLRVEVDSGPPRVVWRDTAFRWAVSLASRGDVLAVGTQDKWVVLLAASASPPRERGRATLDGRPVRLDFLGERTLLASTQALGGGPDRARLFDVSSGAPVAGAVLPVGTTAAAAVREGLAVVALGAGGVGTVETAHPSVPGPSLPGARVEWLAAGKDSSLFAWGEEGGTRRGWWAGAEGGVPRPVPLMGTALLDVTACGGTWCSLDAEHRLCRGAPGTSARACTRADGDAVALAEEPATGLVWVVGAAGALEGFAPLPGWRKVASLPAPDHPGRRGISQLAISGRLAVSLDALQGALYVTDLSVTPPRPRGVFLLQARPGGMALRGGLVFVALPSAGLQVVELSQPDRPRERGWLPLEPGPQAVAVKEARVGGALLALAQGEAGVSLWAWEDRAPPRPLQRVDTPGLALDVAFLGRALWVADGTGLVRHDTREVRP